MDDTNRIKAITAVLEYALSHQPDENKGGAPMQIAFLGGGTAPGTLVKGPIDGAYTLKVVATDERKRPIGMVDIIFTPDVVHHVEIPIAMEQSSVIAPKGAGNIILPSRS
jgi:hypothetical protein